MKKILFGFLLMSVTSCIAIGEQTLKVQNKIIAPKEISINLNSGPWMGEIERRLQAEGFKVIISSSSGQTTVTNKDKQFKYNQATAKYFLQINAAARTDLMARCFGGGYNFDYIYANLIDIQTQETIASIHSRGFSEGCPPLEGAIYTNIAKMVSDSWHPNVSASKNTNLTQEKAILEYFTNRKLDPIEGIWGRDRSVSLIKKTATGYDEMTINSSAGFTQSGEIFGKFKKVSELNYSGEATFFWKENNEVTKFPCTTNVKLESNNKYSRTCVTKDGRSHKDELMRIWPENFDEYNKKISGGN
jgi:hypothetical protein